MLRMLCIAFFLSSLSLSRYRPAFRPAFIDQARRHKSDTLSNATGVEGGGGFLNYKTMNFHAESFERVGRKPSFILKLKAS